MHCLTLKNVDMFFVITDSLHKGYHSMIRDLFQIYHIQKLSMLDFCMKKIHLRVY